MGRRPTPTCRARWRRLDSSLSFARDRVSRRHRIDGRDTRLSRGAGRTQTSLEFRSGDDLPLQHIDAWIRPVSTTIWRWRVSIEEQSFDQRAPSARTRARVFDETTSSLRKAQRIRHQSEGSTRRYRPAMRRLKMPCLRYGLQMTSSWTCQPVPPPACCSAWTCHPVAGVDAPPPVWTERSRETFSAEVAPTMVPPPPSAIEPTGHVALRTKHRRSVRSGALGPADA